MSEHLTIALKMSLPEPGKYTTESNTSIVYLNLLLLIEKNGQLLTSINDKRDDFISILQMFRYLSKIRSSPAYGVYISQFIRYVGACSSYGCFILRASLLPNKLLEHG